MTKALTRIFISLDFALRFAKSDRGVVAIIFALLLPVMIGAIALGVELGLRQMEQRKLQHAADAAAISGAIGRFETGFADDKNEQLRALTFFVASQGGFTTPDERVALHPYSENPDPKIYEIRYIDDNRVEIRLQRTRPGLFSTLWRRGEGTYISATAEAGFAPKIPPCILGLGRQDRGVDIRGSAATISLEGCTLGANDELFYNADPTIHAQCASPDPRPNDEQCSRGWTAGTSEDPYEAISEFKWENVCQGREDSFIDAINDGSKNDMSGIYCQETDANITGNKTINGQDVTIFLKAGVNIRFGGNVDLKISPPSFGERSGLLFYGPEAKVLISGSAEFSIGCGGMVLDSLHLNGNIDISGQCDVDETENIAFGRTISLLQ